MAVIVEADANCPGVLERVRAGETVVVEQPGRRAVELRLVRTEPKRPPWANADEIVAWFESHSYDPGPAAMNSVQLVREQRGYEADED